MTLDEKLDNFYNAAMEDAAKQSAAIIDDYKKSLEDIFLEHKKEELKKAENTLLLESENFIRERNKLLSTQALDIRRVINKKIEELTDRLFEDVTKKLIEYMKTPEYVDLLELQIKKAMNFAKQEPITIYMNPSDEDKKEELEKRTNASLTISTIDFFGGTRAVIQSKSVLIDNSFITKLKESKDNFTL